MTVSPEPRLLILETSGRVAYVALAQGSRLLEARRLDETRRHARDLAPTVADLLRNRGWQPRQLHAVLVSRGPGSYTGLRVGLMSAKALAYATGCTLLAIDTFAAIAAQAPHEATVLDVLADAQQDKVYVQRFARSGTEWQAGSELRIMPVAQWLAGGEANVWATGPGLRVVGDRLPQGSRTVDASLWEPTPESLLRLGLARCQAGESDDFWTLEPLYARPSSAEEQWRG
jgi:tRNA threonylcarbamoyladenosine biosynthesis protein TsaB